MAEASEKQIDWELVADLVSIERCLQRYASHWTGEGTEERGAIAFIESLVTMAARRAGDNR